MSSRRRIHRNPKTGAMTETLAGRYRSTSIQTAGETGSERYRRYKARRGAEQYERQVREDLLMGRYGRRKEIPTFKEWFKGRYWQEWVVGRRNKPSTVEGKSPCTSSTLSEVRRARSTKSRLGILRRFGRRSSRRGLTDKTHQQHLAVLSKPLHYAADVDIIAKAPKVGLFKVEAPGDRVLGIRAVRAFARGGEDRARRCLRRCVWRARPG